MLPSKSSSEGNNNKGERQRERERQKKALEERRDFFCASLFLLCVVSLFLSVSKRNKVSFVSPEEKKNARCFFCALLILQTLNTIHPRLPFLFFIERKKISSDQFLNSLNMIP